MQGFYGNVAMPTQPTFLSMMGALRGFPQGNPFLTPAFPMATSSNHYKELMSRQQMVQSQLGIFGGFPQTSVLSNQIPRFPWGSLSPPSGSPATNFSFGKNFGPKLLETAKLSQESPKIESPEVSTSGSSEKTQKSPLTHEKSFPSQTSFLPNLNPASQFHMNQGKYLNPFSTLQLPSFQVPRLK